MGTDRNSELRCVICTGATLFEKEMLAMFSFIIQHTSRSEAQVCVKNYNGDANNKDVITVDYLITGGR